MSAIEETDLDKVQLDLTAWLKTKLVDAEDIQITNLKKPGGSGFSNDTLLCDLAYCDNGESITMGLVIRISPTGFPIFPFYDIPRQFDIMTALANNTTIAVPNCLWKEYDKSILGEEFYVMEYVAGDIPTDNPPYPIEGFVCEASPKQREKLWWSGVEQLGEIAKVDPIAAKLDFLMWPDDGQTPIAHHLKYYEDYFIWAASGRSMPVAEAALRWLKDNMPTNEPLGLVWGDARLGNQIFQDFSVVSVIDWEMAAAGNPEADLAWWLFVDMVTVAGNGQPDWVAPRLDGLPSHEATVERYEQLTGRPVEYLKFYQVFAGFRFAAVMMRIMQQLVGLELIDAELCEALERNNVVTQLLAELLGLPAPE